jgi:solute carrier family 35 protein F1/2
MLCPVLPAGVSSQALTNQGVYAPTTQAFFNYCLLATVFGLSSILLPLLRHKKQPKARSTATPGTAVNGDVGAAATSSSSSGEDAAAKWTRLRKSWPSFAALALIDVEANVLVTKAYQYTSLTSVTLLDCFTIPCVMLLSWLLLRARYKPGHYIGAVCCVAGLAVLVLGDSKGSSNSSSTGHLGFLDLVRGTLAAITGSSSSNSSSSGSSPLLGDSLVLMGAVLYGVCNVTQELLLADVEPGHLLALLGAFGALISGAQAALLEHNMLLTVHWSSASVLLPMAGFAAAMFTFYSCVPRVLMLGGATVLNLGLLTSDGWAAVARFLWFGGFEGWSAHFFVASLLLVAGGLVVYTLSGSPKESESDVASTGAGHGSDRGGHMGAAGAVGQHVAYSRLQVSGDVEDQHSSCSAAVSQVGGHHSSSSASSLLSSGVYRPG